MANTSSPRPASRPVATRSSSWRLWWRGQARTADRTFVSRFALRVDHTRAERAQAGVNKWKFPDVVLLDWDVGQVADEGYRLDKNLLEVKRSLGEQPFRLTRVELKVALTLTGFREAEKSTDPSCLFSE